MKGSVWHGCQLKIVCFHSLNSQNKTKCSEGASVIFVNLLFWRFQKQLWRDRFVHDLGFYTVRGLLTGKRVLLSARRPNHSIHL
jgi:hypothetical protein